MRDTSNLGPTFSPNSVKSAARLSGFFFSVPDLYPGGSRRGRTEGEEGATTTGGSREGGRGRGQLRTPQSVQME